MLALVMLVSSDVGLSMLPSFLARSMRTARVHRPVNNRESVFPSYAAGGAGTIVASAALYRDRLPVEWPVRRCCPPSVLTYVPWQKAVDILKIP